MKNFKVLLLAVTLVFTVSSCNKDYPKDIPDWLKDKIKELKKESKWKGCGTHGCKYIYEYSDGSNTIFLYMRSPDFSPSTYIVYDFDGNEICYYTVADSTSCQNIDIENYHFIRKIWTED